MNNTRKFILIAVSAAVILLIIARVRQSGQQPVEQAEVQSQTSSPAVTTTVPSKYVVKYAGTYAVTPDGAEMFMLREDGTAVWTFSGKSKYGTWEAAESMIWISINGNTGKITEKYNRKNGRFINDEDDSRRLVKQ